MKIFFNLFFLISLFTLFSINNAQPLTSDQSSFISAIQNNDLALAANIYDQYKDAGKADEILNFQNEDDNKNTPLHWTIKNNNLNTFTFLINKEKIDLNKRNSQGETPLYLATEKNNKDMVNSLLKKKANPNFKRFITSKSPLLLAIEKGYNNIAKILIEQNYTTPTTNINDIDSDKNTPLIWAVKNRNIQLIKKLISNHADLNKINDAGQTALHIAVQRGSNGDIKIVELLLEVVELLLEAGADKDIKNSAGQTALHIAAQRGSDGDIKIVELLLEAGADKDIKNSAGQTALDITTRNTIKDLLTGRTSWTQLYRKGKEYMKQKK